MVLVPTEELGGTKELQRTENDSDGKAMINVDGVEGEGGDESKWILDHLQKISKILGVSFDAMKKKSWNYSIPL